MWSMEYIKSFDVVMFWFPIYSALGETLLLFSTEQYVEHF